MTSVLLPAVVLMLITLVVGLNMTARRVLEVRSSDLNPQDYPTPSKFDTVLSERAQATANCYKNLFEMPVVFYALSAFVALASAGDAVFISMLCIVFTPTLCRV